MCICIYIYHLYFLNILSNRDYLLLGNQPQRKTISSDLFVNLFCLVTMIIFMHVLLKYYSISVLKYASFSFFLCFSKCWLTSVFYIRKVKSQKPFTYYSVPKLRFLIIQRFCRPIPPTLRSTNHPILTVTHLKTSPALTICFQLLKSDQE